MDKSGPVPYHYVPLPTVTEDAQPPTRTIVKDKGGKITSIEDDTWISRFLNELGRACRTDESIINILRSQWTGTSITERGRNVTALSYAGILCKAGVEKEKTNVFIHELIPSLPDSELTRVINNAYNLNIFGCDRYRYSKKRK